MVNITLNNLSVDEDRPVEIIFTEMAPAAVSATLLTGEMQAHNTFDRPERVKASEFTAYTMTERGVKLTLPKCSVLSLRVK